MISINNDQLTMEEKSGSKNDSYEEYVMKTPKKKKQKSRKKITVKSSQQSMAYAPNLTRIQEENASENSGRSGSSSQHITDSSEKSQLMTSCITES